MLCPCVFRWQSDIISAKLMLAYPSRQSFSSLLSFSVSSNFRFLENNLLKLKKKPEEAGWSSLGSASEETKTFLFVVRASWSWTPVNQTDKLRNRWSGVMLKIWTSFMTTSCVYKLLENCTFQRDITLKKPWTLGTLQYVWFPVRLFAQSFHGAWQPGHRLIPDTTGYQDLIEKGKKS